MNPDDALKMQGRLRAVAIRHFKSLGSRAWDEAVANVLFDAVEMAAKGEYRPMAWWANQLIWGTLNDCRRAGRLVWVDAELSGTDSNGHDWGGMTMLDLVARTRASQEDAVLANEVLAMITKLPNANRDALMLRIDGADLFEIAREMCIDPKKVLLLIRDGRDWLDRV